MFVLIAAVGCQNQIGLNSKLPWRNKEDLMFFKKMTLNHKVVFGRITYESLPPLKNRECFIVSKSKSYPNGIGDFDKYLKENYNSDEMIYIAGGEKIYQKALPYCRYLLLSRINYNGQADTYFPQFDINDYKVEMIKMNSFTIEFYEKKVFTL